jgi:hypothetical protein
LLFIGTRNRSGAGRLDRVIDGLEQKLCKAMEQGYPKIAAAAVIQKRRSQEPRIVAAAKAMAKRGVPTPPVRAVGSTDRGSRCPAIDAGPLQAA